VETEFLETMIENGYDYYKIEIHARLPEEGVVGFKITGIYFAAASESGRPTPDPDLFQQLYLPFVENYIYGR
jgi:hypothetical protein